MPRLALSLPAVALFLAGAAAQSVPLSGPVVVVALENHSYSEVVGSSAMPYFNSLISEGALTTNFFANTHPSISNYFMLTTGELVTLESGFNARVSIDNLVRRAKAAGKIWRSYAQSLPYAGFLGDQYPYVKRHNPFAYFTDVIDSSEQKARIVPFTQFTTDVNAGALPDLSFVIPDQYHNGHDCPGGGSCANADKLAAADRFLADTLPQLLNSADFQANGLLVVWWDEGSLSDFTNGGGRIAVVLVGPRVKRGYRAGTFYRQEHLARTLFEVLGLSTALGSIRYVSPLAEVFTSGQSGCTATSIGVTLCQPSSDTVTSPVRVTAAAKSNYPITGMWIYLDYVAVYKTTAASLDTTLTMARGTHSLIVKAWDSTGASYKVTRTLTVQ